MSSNRQKTRYLLQRAPLRSVCDLFLLSCSLHLLAGTASAKPAIDAPAPEDPTPSTTTRPQMPSVSSSYRMAYLNISYVDSERKVWHTERTETGRFSSAGVRESGGVAVEMLSSIPDTHDNTGCSPPFKQNFPTNEPWIAVIKRGQCTFNQKIKNALSLNASGVLVYDKEGGAGTLQSMKVERFPIPSVFTYHWKGTEILKLMESMGRVYITLQEGSLCRTTATRSESNGSLSKSLYCTPPLSWDDIADIFSKQGGGKGGLNPYLNWNLTMDPSNPGSDIFYMEKRTSVLLVSVSFIVLMIISLVWLVFYYVQRFRYIHAKDQLERKLCSQAKRALSIISTSVLKKDDLEMKDFSETCAVCIEAYRVADVVRILPCKHQFHKVCIDQWLLEKRTCPMCKMDILKHYGLVEESRSRTRSVEDPPAAQEAEANRRPLTAPSEDEDEGEEAIISIA